MCFKLVFVRFGVTVWFSGREIQELAISTCTVHDVTASLEVVSSLDVIVSITPRGVFREVLTGTKIPDSWREEGSYAKRYIVIIRMTPALR